MGDSGFSLIPFIGGEVIGDLYTLGEPIFILGDILILGGDNLGVKGDCFGDTLLGSSTL